MDNGLLDFLLRGAGLDALAGPQDQAQAPQAQATPPMQPPQQEAPITIQHPRDHGPREGVLHGGFRVGHTGGNILGAIGDAFLTQAGRDRQYAPRVARERQAQALEGFTDEPMAAANRLASVDPSSAMDFYHNLVRDGAYHSQQDALEDTRRQQIEDRSIGRIASLGGTMNEQNYAGVRTAIQRYATANHIQLPFDLPEAYSPEVREQLLRYGTPAGQQITADNLTDYRSTQQDLARTRQDSLSAYRDAYLDALRSYRRDQTGISRDRVGVSRDQATIAQQRADEEKRHHVFTEEHPRGGRRGIPGQGGPALIEGGRYREGQRTFTYRNGRRVYD